MRAATRRTASSTSLSAIAMCLMARILTPMIGGAIAAATAICASASRVVLITGPPGSSVRQETDLFGRTR